MLLDIAPENQWKCILRYKVSIALFHFMFKWKCILRYKVSIALFHFMFYKKPRMQKSLQTVTATSPSPHTLSQSLSLLLRLSLSNTIQCMSRTKSSKPQQLPTLSSDYFFGKLYDHFYSLLSIHVWDVFGQFNKNMKTKAPHTRTQSVKLYNSRKMDYSQPRDARLFTKFADKLMTYKL